MRSTLIAFAAGLVVAALLLAVGLTVFGGADEEAGTADDGGDDGPVAAIVSSPDGDDGTATSAATSDGAAVTGDDVLVDTASQARVGVVALTWSPTADLLAVGHADGRVELWDTADRAMRHDLDVEAVEDVAWSADGSRLAIATGGDLIIWEGPAFEAARSLGRAGRRVAWVDGGELAAARSGDVFVIDTETATVVGTYEPPAGDLPDLWSLTVSPDGGVIVAGAADGVLFVWDVDQVRLPARLTYPTSTVGIQRLRWAPDGALVAGGLDQSLKFWNIEQRDKFRTWTDRSDSTDFVWSPDGATLVSVGGIDELRFWDVVSAEIAVVAAGHNASATAVAWSERGGLASGAADGAVLLWDLSRPGSPLPSPLS